MTMEKKKRYWFKEKEYDWGILAPCIGFIVWNAIRLDAHSHSVSDTLLKSGERPAWRWGSKR